MAETPFQNVDDELLDVIAARNAQLEAYRQRMLAAADDPTHYSPDYSDRDGEDLNADGYWWSTDFGQYVTEGEGGGDPGGSDSHPAARWHSVVDDGDGVAVYGEDNNGTIVVIDNSEAWLLFDSELPVGHRFNVYNGGSGVLYVYDTSEGDITWIGIQVDEFDFPGERIVDAGCTFYFEKIGVDQWLGVMVGCGDSYTGGGGGGEFELETPEPEHTVNPGGNEISIEWPPVDGATNAIVEVIVESGEPVVWETPQNPATIVFAAEPGEHAVRITVTGPGGAISAPSAPIEEELVETPLFQTGMWPTSGLTGSEKAKMWFATPQGRLFIKEEGTEGVALVEYQLQLAGDPTVEEIHMIPDAPVGFDELFPVRRVGSYMYYLAMNQTTDTLHLRSYDLVFNEVVDEISLAFQYPGHKWTWDAGHLFVNVTSPGGGGGVVEVVNMYDPSNLTKESIACPVNDGTLSGAIITEGHLYVTGDGAFDEQRCFVVSLPSPEVLNNVSWLTDSEITMGMLGPGWAIILVDDGRIMHWDLNDPLNPVWGGGAWLDTGGGGPFPSGKLNGIYQLLGDHAVDLNRIQSGAIGALLGGERLLMYGPMNPYSSDGGVIYAEVDISTYEAREDMELVNIISDEDWGFVWPQARLGAVQTVGMMNQMGGNIGQEQAEVQVIFVGSTPATEPGWEGIPE